MVVVAVEADVAAEDALVEGAADVLAALLVLDPVELCSAVSLVDVPDSLGATSLDELLCGATAGTNSLADGGTV